MGGKFKVGFRFSNTGSVVWYHVFAKSERAAFRKVQRKYGLTMDDGSWDGIALLPRKRRK